MPVVPRCSSHVLLPYPLLPRALSALSIPSQSPSPSSSSNPLSLASQKTHNRCEKRVARPSNSANVILELLSGLRLRSSVVSVYRILINSSLEFPNIIIKRIFEPQNPSESLLSWIWVSEALHIPPRDARCAHTPKKSDNQTKRKWGWDAKEEGWE